MTDNTPALVVEDMHKSFGKIEVLKGVGVLAHQGDVISMVGSSGSGKALSYAVSICWKYLIPEQ